MTSKKKATSLAETLKKNRESASSTNTVAHNVQNYKKRLGHAGIDPEGAVDKRNPIEKVLNLEEDQNVLFDIFEIMGRPQQALFGAIDSAQKGENALKGAWEGLKGDKETSGGQLLRNAGIDSDGINGAKEGGLNPLSWGIDDVLGFGLDILADPVDIALLASVPATGGASTPAVAAKFAGDAAQTGKVVKAASKADDVIDAIKVADKASDVIDTIKVADKASDVAKTRYAIRPFQKGAKSISQLVMEGAGKGIKKAFNLGDTALEKALKYVDNATLNKIKKYATANNITDVEAIKALNLTPDLLENYQDIKRLGKKAINSSKDLKGFIRKGREIENIADIERKGASLLSKELDDTAKAIAKKMAKSVDDEPQMYEDISKAINTMIESKRDWSIKGDEIVGALSSTKKLDMFNEENARMLVQKLKDYEIDAKILDNRYVKIVDDSKIFTETKDNLKILKGSPKLKEEFGALQFGERLSKADRDDIEAARKLLESSPELQDLYKRAEEFIPTVAKQSDILTGLDAANIADEGYVPHVLTDDYRDATKNGKKANPTKVYDSRKLQMTSNEANRFKEEIAKRKKLATPDKISKEEAKIYKTDEFGKKILDSSGNPIRDDVAYRKKVQQQQQKIDTLKKTKESVNELLNYKKTGKLDVSKLTKENADKLKELQKKESLQETLNNLNKIDVSNVTKEAPVNDVSKAVDNLKKSQKELVDALLKNSNDDTIKTLENNMEEADKLLKIKVKALSDYADKSARDILKEATKSFEQGEDIGKKIQKTKMKLATNIENSNNIYQAAADLSDSLTTEIKLAEEKLLQINSDDIFKRAENNITRLRNSENILNSVEGKEFFETNFFTNIDTYINRSSEFNRAAQLWNEAITTGIFRNTDYVKTFDNLKDGKVPFGFTKVNGNDAKRFLEKYKGILPDNSESFNDVMKFFSDNNTLFMDKDLANMFKIADGVSKDQIHPLLKFWDGINRTFKKFSTLTLGFHARNIIGNTTNMALSGMPVKDMPEYYKKSAELWNKADDLTKKFFQGTLTDAEKADWSILEQFYKGGFSNESYSKLMGLEDIKSVRKGPINKISQKSIDMNEFVDGHNRLALLMYANDNPAYVQRLGKKDAIETVKYVLFDPSNMSNLEKTALKRIMPFYTFTKQNLMFQADNIMRNTPRYNKLFKALNKTYDAVGDDAYNSYQKDSMQIPLPFTDKEGNQLFLKANLPLSDLGEWMSNPIQRAVSSTSPIIKAPIEYVTGIDTFTGQPSYKTKTEQLLTSLGLQNVSTNLKRKAEAIVSRYNGDTTNQEMFAELFRSLVQNVNRENVIQSGLYDELEAYQALVKQLKEQGQQVPTLTDINRIRKNRINAIMKKRANS